MNNIREYILCRDDIFYFMEKYLKIELRGFQIDILSKYWKLETGKTENILGCRGCGLTTVSCIYVLWRALFYPGNSIAFYAPTLWVVRHIKDTFCDLYKLVQRNWDVTQKRYVLERAHDRYIKFDNNTYIHFTHTKEQLRGNRFDIIFYDSTYLSDDSAEVFELTVNGTHKSVILNTFLPPEEHELEKVGILTTYPWYCNPDLTQEWYSSMLNSLGNTEFKKQFECTRGNSNGEF